MQSYDYQLTPAEKDALITLMRDGVRLVNVASTNKTTIDPS